MDMDKNARRLGEATQRLWAPALGSERDAWRLLAFAVGPCVVPSARRYIELLGEAGLSEAAWPVAGLLQAVEGPRSIDWAALAEKLCEGRSYAEARDLLEGDDPPSWALWCEYWSDAVDDGPQELPPLSMAVQMAEAVIDQLQRRLRSDSPPSTGTAPRGPQLYAAHLPPIWVLAGSERAAYQTGLDILRSMSLPAMKTTHNPDDIVGHEGEVVALADLPYEDRVNVEDALRIVIAPTPDDP